MDFHPNEDQSAFLSVLEQIMSSADAGWRVSPDWSRFMWSAELDTALETNGFFDCAAEESLGLTMAAAMTSKLATLPVLVECGASSMVRPMLGAAVARPMAIVEHGMDAAVPFLPVARSVLVVDDNRVRIASITPAMIDQTESLYAYPMGRLRNASELNWSDLPADPGLVRRLWQVATAAELAGVLKGGLDTVVSHVTTRRQFGRPLGSFQAIQHRLAAASQKIDAAYWLSLRAAQSLEVTDATIALSYAQDASTRIIYDLHQFMGAMGLTLEHPLHRWTYRARLLRARMGGGSVVAREYFKARWGTA